MLVCFFSSQCSSNVAVLSAGRNDVQFLTIMYPADIVSLRPCQRYNLLYCNISLFRRIMAHSKANK